MDRKKFIQRKKRVRAKIGSHAIWPRLSVFRSNRYIYAQIIDDVIGKTLVGISGKEKSIIKGKTKMERAQLAGETIASKAIAKKIKKVVFDKSGYKYHGQIKALADGARKGGLEF
jgi:large subunit ribosomal protein L18